MMRWTRRDFVTRTVGTGVGAALGGMAVVGCSSGVDPGESGVIEDPAAVKGGPKTTPNKDVIYPEGYVGPIASHKERIVVKGERVELTVVVPQNSIVGDYAENAFTKWYEKRTGVHVKWRAVGIDETVGGDTAEAETMTKVNAMIASGDLPDVFMSVPFSPSQIYVNGLQGLFTALESYIDDYGVEIKRIFKDYPDTRELITAPDDHIYSMPYVNDCYHCRGGENRVWVYRPWLDKLGLDIPESLDDFEAMLEAFVNEDPNGNGRPDELPLLTEKNTKLDAFIMGSFLYSPGEPEPWRFLDNGKVDVVYNKDAWREGLRYLNRLFEKGLLGKESFTQDDETLQRLGDQKTPILGAVRGWYWGTFMTIDDDDPNARFRDYEAVPTLRGPDGTRTASWDYYNWLYLNHFVVTTACKNPAVAVMWADGQYELEAQMNSYGGVRGENWRFAKKGEVGINGNQALWTTLGVWGGPEMEGKWWDQNGANYRSSDYRLGEVVDPKSPTFEKALYEETRDKYFPHRQPKEMQLPPLYMTEEQATLAGELQTTLENQVYTAVAEFTLGRRDIDSEDDWTEYIDALEKTGLQRYLEAHQEAYDEKYGGK